MHPLAAPAREVLWRQVAALAYHSLPPFAHVLYGRPAPSDDTVTRRLRATGNPLRCIPSRMRRQLPPKHILRAVARLGPQVRPDPYRPHGVAAILDGPEGEPRGDGGDSARWRTRG